MEEFKRMILKVSDVQGAVATIPSTSDHTDGSWLVTDIYVGELFLNTTDNILQTRTDSGIVTLNNAGSDVNWGDILGTLSDQTDLQNALNDKINYSDYTPSHSLLVQQSGTGSPTSLSVGNNTLVGRLSGGGSEITDLSIAEVKELLNFGTGTTNYVSKWIDSDTIGNSQIFDDGTNVGIGTTSPSEALDVVGKIALNDGGNSVFVGTNAGLNDDGTNNQNVGIGYQSLRNNTTGGGNTATGVGSLQNNTTGANNTANGFYSLTSNTTGSQNTATGFYSLTSNTTGSQNTANGRTSLYNNTTGGANTATGLNSGRFISDGTTANTITNNSVYLGYNTKALANNQTNQIVIGYDATGAGSNTATLGNDSITKTILRGNVSTNGSVQVGDNTDTASSANVGAMRYRTDGSASYADMCMETSSGTYEWVNIVTNTF